MSRVFKDWITEFHTNSNQHNWKPVASQWWNWLLNPLLETNRRTKPNRNSRSVVVRHQLPFKSSELTCCHSFFLYYLIWSGLSVFFLFICFHYTLYYNQFIIITLLLPQPKKLWLCVAVYRLLLLYFYIRFFYKSYTIIFLQDLFLWIALVVKSSFFVHISTRPVLFQSVAYNLLTDVWFLLNSLHWISYAGQTKTWWNGNHLQYLCNFSASLLCFNTWL